MFIPSTPAEAFALLAENHNDLHRLMYPKRIGLQEPADISLDKANAIAADTVAEANENLLIKLLDSVPESVR